MQSGGRTAEGVGEEGVGPWWAEDLSDAFLSAALAAHLGDDVATFTWAPRELEQCNCAVVTAHAHGGERGVARGTVFVKRADVRWLQAKASKTAEKWAVSVQSFMNEASFYELAKWGGLSSAGAAVPRALLIQSVVDTPGAGVGEDGFFDRRFTSILECLSPDAYEEFRAFDVGQTLAALGYLARFHAYWWRGGEEEGEETGTAPGHPSTASAAEWDAAVSHLFCPGGWWRAPLRPSVNFTALPAVFEALTASLPACASLASADNAELASWLAANVATITAAVLGEEGGEAPRGSAAGAPWRTLVHGDFKTSNVFFKRCGGEAGVGSDASSTSSPPPPPHPAPALTSIDFQWTGPALSGMGDVAYLLLGGVQGRVLYGGAGEGERGAEARIRGHPHFAGGQGVGVGTPAEPAPVVALLDHYHACLVTALSRRGGWGRGGAAVAYPRAAVSVDWRLECCDYTKTCVPYLLAGLTPYLQAENAGKYGWLTHEYDEGMTRWLLETTLGCCADVKARQDAGLTLAWY